MRFFLLWIFPSQFLWRKERFPPSLIISCVHCLRPRNFRIWTIKSGAPRKWKQLCASGLPLDFSFILPLCYAVKTNHKLFDKINGLQDILHHSEMRVVIEERFFDWGERYWSRGVFNKQYFKHKTFPFTIFLSCFVGGWIWRGIHLPF